MVVRDGADVARLYAMFMNFPTIVEDIHDGLFSIEAQRISVNGHSSHANILIGRLTEMQRQLKQARCNHEVHGASTDNYRRIKPSRKGI
jgi:hypothetical protein